MVAAREDRETVNTLFVCHRADNSRRRLRRRLDANGCNGDNKQFWLKNLLGLLMGHKSGCLLMMPLEIEFFWDRTRLRVGSGDMSIQGKNRVDNSVCGR
jgi:hypothetical protein